MHTPPPTPTPPKKSADFGAVLTDVALAREMLIEYQPIAHKCAYFCSSKLVSCKWDSMPVGSAGAGPNDSKHYRGNLNIMIALGSQQRGPDCCNHDTHHCVLVPVCPLISSMFVLVSVWPLISSVFVLVSVWPLISSMFVLVSVWHLQHVCVGLRVASHLQHVCIGLCVASHLQHVCVGLCVAYHLQHLCVGLCVASHLQHPFFWVYAQLYHVFYILWACLFSYRDARIFISQ